ncbi:dUTP diphosphatase [Lipomyces tetrasporus]
MQSATRLTSYAHWQIYIAFLAVSIFFTTAVHPFYIASVLTSLRYATHIKSFVRLQDRKMSPATISSAPITEQVTESSNKKRKLVDSDLVLQVKLLSDKAKTPTRGSLLAAGYDIYGVEDVLIKAQDRAMIATDIAVAIPAGHYGRIAPRSGLATKHGIQTGAGVIDADYRGPLKMLLFNQSNQDFQIHAGDRIAQMVIEKIITPEIVTVAELDETDRGANGFGSTGGFGAR